MNIKRSMCVSVITALLLGISSSMFAYKNYDEMIHDLKHKMYARQQGIIGNYDAYKKIIDPFLEQAEQKLNTLKYIKKTDNFSFAPEFMQAFLRCNVMYFNNKYVASNDAYMPMLERAFNEMRQILLDNERKIQSKIPDFDVDTEMKNIKNLIEEGNKQYSKQLPWKTRGALFLYRTFG